MKILVACEESQAVTIELRKLGHKAYSCDTEPCSGGHPEWIKAFEYLWNSTLDKHKIDRLGWNANPWVFVIEFERCEKQEK